MKLLGVMALASTLIGEATALYIEKTCANLSLNPSTDVLSANCNNKKGVANPNSLDLNTCLGWNDEDSAITYVSESSNIHTDDQMELVALNPVFTRRSRTNRPLFIGHELWQRLQGLLSRNAIP